jgi:ABC-type phosphate/phosphonate transport system substrate-binding protein
MLATLPMYDWPEIRQATDAWWAGMARHLGVQECLSRPADYMSAWRDPALLFSQTCGYPYTHEFRGQLKLVAVPHYAAEGCQGADYCSFVFAREGWSPDRLSQSRAAYSAADSMSGMLALKAVFAPFASAIETGSHLASLRAVREGQADVCAIDAVCVALARRYRPKDLTGLIPVAKSPPMPGLPYVTRAGDVAALQRALHDAFADPALASARKQLLLTGFSLPGAVDYTRIPALEADLGTVSLAPGLAATNSSRVSQ